MKPSDGSYRPLRQPNNPAEQQVDVRRHNRDGSFFVQFADGNEVRGSLGHPILPPTSAIASWTVDRASAHVHVETVRGDEIRISLLLPDAPAPVNSRPTIYLDQNHWSTLTNAIHQPGRVVPDEGDAAERLIGLVRAGAVILPMSGAHIAETTGSPDVCVGGQAA